MAIQPGFSAPAADSTNVATTKDTIGRKTDAAATTIGTTKSLVAYLKGLLTWIGTITNTGGTATIGAAIGDPANSSLVTRIAAIPTTSPTVVPVATADATNNVYLQDPVGNKTDASVTAVGTTKSIIAYLKGLITMGTVQSADSTANAFEGDVTGNKTDASVIVVGTTKSIIAYVKGLLNQIGTLVNTGGTATIGAILGDWTNSTLYSAMTGGVNAVNRASGQIQVLEVANTSAANAGAVTVATVNTQKCLIKSIVVRANSGNTSALTNLTITGGSGGAVTFLNSSDGIQANFNATDKQVGWTGAVSLPATGTIVITLTGTASTAVDLLVTIEYESIVSGGYLS